jgi:hypothetical protein
MNWLEALRKALINYATGSAFLTALTGGLWYGDAPDCAPGSGTIIKPYCIMSFPTLAERNTFTETIHNGLVQFLIYTPTIPLGESILSSCADLYDSSGGESTKWIQPASNISAFILTRNVIIPPERSTRDKFTNYQSMIDYHIMAHQY